MLLRERFGAGGSGLGPTTGSNRFRGRCSRSAIVFMPFARLAACAAVAWEQTWWTGEVFGIQYRDRYDWKIAERQCLARLPL
jgi:hypothetical protein